ncbi:hypothetical protein [Sorangium sp. So ce1335]|uniref:hypothetical protein n=1 Tax=Sorangium sp. So ce1335 TaxID=3133335 RepID=UPI003F62EB01
MNVILRCLIPVALFHMLACSDPVESPAGSGTGGNTSEDPSSSSASTSTGSAPDDPSSSSASTGAGSDPVACVQGEGAPPGSACANEGEQCDYACSSCSVVCTDGVWVEQCTECPDVLPEDGASCEGHYGVGPCSYEFDCGTQTATCDGATGLWVVDELDCGGEGGEGGGSNGGGGSDEGEVGGCG